MRTVLFTLSCLFAAACGGRVEASSETDHTRAFPGPVATAAEVCPHICGTGTLCKLADGSCGEACNACLCRAEGGRVVAACDPSSSSDQPSSDQPSSEGPSSEGPSSEGPSSEGPSPSGPSSQDPVPALPAEPLDKAPHGEVCGDTVCKKSEYCCNASCSICAPVGGFCTQQLCEP